MIFHELFRVASPVSPYARGLVILLCFLISLTNQTTTEEPTTAPPHDQVRLKEVTCSDSTMTVTLLFTNKFKGRVYTRNFPHIGECGFHVPEHFFVDKGHLEIQHHTCGTKLNRTSSGEVFVKNRVKVRFHPTIHHKHDTALTVSCTIPKLAAPPSGHSPRDFVKYDKREARLDVVLGSELNPDSFTDVDASAFYLKVTVVRRFHDTDVVVRNCIAHDTKILDDNATLCRLNDIYGCGASKILDENFPVLNELTNVVKVLKFKDPAILTMKPLFITCGIDVCDKHCVRYCGLKEINRPSTFTHLAQKVIHLNRSVLSDILPEAGQDIYSNCLA